MDFVVKELYELRIYRKEHTERLPQNSLSVWQESFKNFEYIRSPAHTTDVYGYFYCCFFAEIQEYAMYTCNLTLTSRSCRQHADVLPFCRFAKHLRNGKMKKLKNRTEAVFQHFQTGVRCRWQGESVEKLK